jgi:GT2 family glycosyltransferase
MSLFAVILHYGAVERTMRLHRQLLASDPGERERILVFDNCAAQPYPEAWMRSERNLYWAGAFETTVETLAARGATHVWFLNNDLEFMTRSPIIGRVRERLARAERLLGPVGVYSPAVTSNPYHPQMVELRGGQFRQTRYVDGIAPLVSLEFWRRAGGLDHEGNPYGYGVDVWFSSRSAECGFACVVDHQVVVRHRYHSTAREVDGFLEQAAAAEKSFLVLRLGHDYRAVMARMAGDYRELG